MTAPAESVAETIRQAPEHPYARIGAERFGALAAEAAALLAEAGVAVEGDAARNHYRLTPMGGLKPAWLTLAGYVRSEASDALPWRKAVLFSSEQAYKHNGNAPCFSCGGNDMHGDIGDVPEVCA